MNSESVDLIATDPPFNKGRDFHATPDSLAAGARFQDRWSWERDVHSDWLDTIRDDWPAVWEVIDAANAVYMRKTKKNLKKPREEVGSDMGAFLCFMAVRLLAMRRVLKPTGSIYLHCDPTASHWIKALMDSVFDKSGFRNEIIWRRSAAHNAAGRFGPNHDVILFYAKPDYRHRVKFSPYSHGYVADYFKKSDERGHYREQEIHGSGTRNGVSGQPWRGFDPTAKGRHWAVPSKLILALGIDPDLQQHEKLDALYERGCIDLNSDYLPTYRQYLSDGPGVPFQDVWAFQPYTNGLLRGTDDEIDRDVKWLPGRDKKERTGFRTQKPIGLYSRIIRSSSDEGQIVLDPFAGCATTLVAAESLRRQWVGIDIWEKAHEVVLDRLKREVGLFGDVTFTNQLPERTDDGETAAPFLRVKVKVKEPAGPRWTRAQMYAHLIEQHGSICQGCDRTFDDPRNLELDHNIPRSDGGINHVTNRILLCGPCNRLKSNIYTLSGLRRKNKRLGYMAGSESPILKEIREKRERNPELFD